MLPEDGDDEAPEDGADSEDEADAGSDDVALEDIDDDALRSQVQAGGASRGVCRPAGSLAPLTSDPSDQSLWREGKCTPEGAPQDPKHRRHPWHC